MANDLWLTAVLITAVALVLLELSPVSDALMRVGDRRRGEDRTAPTDDDVA